MADSLRKREIFRLPYHRGSVARGWTRYWSPINLKSKETK